MGAATRRAVRGTGAAGHVALVAACGQTSTDGDAGAAETHAPATIHWRDQERTAFKQFAAAVAYPPIDY